MGEPGWVRAGKSVPPARPTNVSVVGSTRAPPGTRAVAIDPAPYTAVPLLSVLGAAQRLAIFTSYTRSRMPWPSERTVVGVCARFDGIGHLVARPERITGNVEHMAMVGRDDDQRVPQVNGSDGGADRFVEFLRVVQRAQGIAVMVRMIDPPDSRPSESSRCHGSSGPVAADHAFRRSIALSVIAVRLGSPPASVARSYSHSMWLLSKRPSTGRLCRVSAAEPSRVADVGVARALILGAQVAAIRAAAACRLLVDDGVGNEVPAAATEEHVDAVLERAGCTSHRSGVTAARWRSRCRGC